MRTESRRDAARLKIPVTPDLEGYRLDICRYAGRRGNLAQMSAQVEPGA
jgi:hypothetical protein